MWLEGAVTGNIVFPLPDCQHSSLQLTACIPIHPLLSEWCACVCVCVCMIELLIVSCMPISTSLCLELYLSHCLCVWAQAKRMVESLNIHPPLTSVIAGAVEIILFDSLQCDMLPSLLTLCFQPAHGLIWSHCHDMTSSPARYYCCNGNKPQYFMWPPPAT